MNTASRTLPVSTGLPGAHRHPPGGNRSHLGDDLADPVVIADADAGGADDDVEPGSSVQKGSERLLKSRAIPRKVGTPPASRTAAASIGELESTSCAGITAYTGRDKLIAGGDERDTRPAADQDLRMTERCCNRDIDASKHLPRVEHGGPGSHVAPAAANAGALRGGDFDANSRSVTRGVLLADDGVRSVGHRCPGHDPHRCAGLERTRHRPRPQLTDDGKRHRCAGVCGSNVLCEQRISVHCWKSKPGSSDSEATVSASTRPSAASRLTVSGARIRTSSSSRACAPATVSRSGETACASVM